MAAEFTAQATAMYEPFEEDLSDQDINEPSLSGPPEIPPRTSTPGASVHNGYRNATMNPPAVPSKPVIKGTQGVNGVRPGTLSGGISYRNVRNSNNTAAADAPSVNGLNDLPDRPDRNGPEGRRSGSINPAPMGLNGLNPYRTTSVKRAYPHIDTELVKEKALRRSRSAVTVTANQENSDKTEGSSHEDARGDWRKSIGNPSPLSLLGTFISLGPLACDLMGWAGATGGGQASIGAYFFFGGMLLTIAGLLEFVLGNTFSFVVDMTYSGFWLTLGATLHPSFNAFGAYSSDATKPALGQATVAFNSSFAFFLLFMGILSTIYFICALRTDICSAIIFLTLALGFGLATGQHFYIGAGYMEGANTLGIAAGASFFVTCMAVLWVFASIMLEVLDFPFRIPTGDLSNFIKSNTVRMEEFRYLEDLRNIEEMRYMDKRQMQDMRYMM